MLNVLRCRVTYYGHAVTNAEARFNIAWRPRKPEGSLGRTAQDAATSTFTQLLNYGAPRNTILCIFTETKWQTFRGIPGFYSTSGAVAYTAVIFWAHLVAVKCEVFTTTSTREIQLCARPATQLTCSPLLAADFTRQSIAHARKSKWKAGILSHEIKPTRYHRRNINITLKTLARCTYLISLTKAVPKKLSVRACTADDLWCKNFFFA